MAKKKKKNKKESKKKDEKKDKNEENIKEGPLREIKIRIIGIGGGGGSIVSEISTDLKKVRFAAANTDASALESLKKKKIKKLQFGKEITKGLGTGMDPKVGKEAALEAEDEIEKLVEGQDVNILVSCLGGGTGSGALPVFAKKSKQSGALTYGIFTLPFDFEGQKKMSITKEAMKNASPHLNAISILPNENIFKIVDRTTPLKKALSQMNKNLAANLEGLVETIYEAGLINIDFADIKTVLNEEKGKRKLAYLSSTVIEKEEEDAKDIVKKATSNPLYPHGIEGARGILFNITGGEDLGLAEISAISQEISGFTDASAKVIFGVSQEKNFKGRMKISLLATGCGANYFSEEISASGEADDDLDEEIEKITINEGEDEDSENDREKDKKDEKSKDKDKKQKKEDKKKEEKKEKKEEELKVQTSIEDIDEEEAAETLSKEKEEPKSEDEKEIMEEEEKWETPTFLRKALNKNDENSKKGDN